MNKRIIPIVFSVNNDYTLFGYMAIYSLIMHSSEENEYDIFVFVTGLNQENQNLLESLSTSNVIIRCIDISDRLKGVHLKSSIHLSVETYYRLFIPLILPEFKRVLYLDSDLVVLEDVAELYDYDFDGKSVVVVQDVFCNNLRIHSKEIGNLDYKKTFNAGVLLMDTRRFEEEKIREKCLKLLEEDYQRKERKLIFADQDALNIVLYENVTFADPKWNSQYQYAWRIDEVDEDYRERYLYDLDHAAIIHYAGTNKPWVFPLLPKADVFWDIAKDTPVFLDLIETVINTSKKSVTVTPTKKYLFPYEMVPPNSRIGLYGAGKIGKEFYSQINESNYVEIAIWVDKNAETIQGEYDVKTIGSINAKDFDYMVIAVKNRAAAKEIRDLLQNIGIDNKRIIWKPY